MVEHWNIYLLSNFQQTFALLNLRNRTGYNKIQLLSN